MREVNRGDATFRGVSSVFALAVVGVLLIIVSALFVASIPTFRAEGLGFIVGTTWDPVQEKFGALPFLAGTLVSSLLALLMAVPVSLGIAIFLTELAPDWLRTPLGFLVELLAAVPSVIYGLWGIEVLVPGLRDHVAPFMGRWLGGVSFFSSTSAAGGTGLFAASLILALMILPTISSVSREVLRVVPTGLREGALALGATRWETLRTVVLPFAKSGLVGAVILGLGRALGETMAVTMVIGNAPRMPSSLFAPAATMASIIANQYGEAHGSQLGALTSLGLLLMVATLALNVLARILVLRSRHQNGGGR